MLSILFGLVGIGVAIALSKPQDLLEIRKLTPFSVGGGLVFVALSFACGGLRILLLARRLDEKINFWRATRAHILGLFSAAVTPSGSGNAPAIALMLQRDGVGSHHAWSISFYTGIIDLILFTWCVPVCLTILKLTGTLPPKPWLIASSVLICAVFIALWALLTFQLPRVPRFIMTLFSLRPLRRYRLRASRFSRALTTTIRELSRPRGLEPLVQQLLALGVHFSIFLIFPIFAHELGLDFSYVPTIALMFLLFILAHVVPTPGGSGFMELTLPLLLMPERPSAVVPIVIVWRLISFYSLFLIGPALGGVALSKRLGPELPKAVEAAESVP